MKGFFIEISNELIDPKHCRQMGDSVWLFMWFLDKMTVIDHDIGEGKVLGGKPIKYEDVKDDLGISRSTYIRWLEALRKGEYIRTLRTPYGQVVTVLKAKKRFSRKVSEERDDSEMTHQKEGKMSQKRNISQPKVTHLSHENDTSNKTVSVDNTEDTLSMSGASATKQPTPKEKSEWFFKNIVKDPLPDEMKQFLVQLAERTGMEKRFIWNETRAFVNYWTEKSQSGKSESWQMQKTFEVDRRLDTWFRRADKNVPRGMGMRRQGKGLIIAGKQ